MNPHEVFIHIHQGCFAGTGAIVRLPQCQWSKPDGYGKISQCITTTKHSKAKPCAHFLGYTVRPKDSICTCRVLLWFVVVMHRSSLPISLFNPRRIWVYRSLEHIDNIWHSHCKKHDKTVCIFHITHGWYHAWVSARNVWPSDKERQLWASWSDRKDIRFMEWQHRVSHNMICEPSDNGKSYIFTRFNFIFTLFLTDYTHSICRM